MTPRHLFLIVTSSLINLWAPNFIYYEDFRVCQCVLFLIQNYIAYPYWLGIPLLKESIVLHAQNSEARL